MKLCCVPTNPTLSPFFASPIKRTFCKFSFMLIISFKKLQPEILGECTNYLQIKNDSFQPKACTHKYLLFVQHSFYVHDVVQSTWHVQLCLFFVDVWLKFHFLCFYETFICFTKIVTNTGDFLSINSFACKNTREIRHYCRSVLCACESVSSGIRVACP